MVYSILSQFKSLEYYGKNTQNLDFEPATGPWEAATKKYDDVCLSSWGHLDEFVQFITSFDIFSMLAQLGLTTGHSGIAVVLLAMLAFFKWSIPHTVSFLSNIRDAKTLI